MLKHNLQKLSFLCFFAVAFSATAQQLALIEKMPPELLRYAGGARPDADGMVGYNQGGFKSPEFQCGAMRSMIRAVVRSDTRGVDEGWRAIDAAFQYQNEKLGKP